MRIIITFLFLLIGFSALDAQITIVPLESNPVLEKQAADTEADRVQRFDRFYGSEQNNSNSRELDCDNEDGVFFSGETIYLVAGDSVELCYVIYDIDTLYDNSVDLSSGTSVLADSSCVVYYSDSGVELNITDTIRISKCDTLGCLEFVYPVVVKRADENYIIPPIQLDQEEEMELCVPTFTLPGEIYGTSFIDCSNTPMLGDVFNVNFQDSCFVYVASRFAEPDEICFEVCDEYCICDTYTYTFTTAVDAIDYPFIDDFSYQGPHPSKRKWLNDDVFINTTMAYQPPSVGVATFDGLDETGSPRGSGSGRADFLTSNYFNLSASDTDLWLSFWLQNKGITYGSNPGDVFEVEFRDSNGDWITVFTKDGFDLSLLERDTFNFYKIPLDNGDDNFLHSDFQFRFVNTAGLSSMNDSWHLDYVRLDQTEPDSTFDDLAFGRLPSDILGRYSSMPWWQFEGFIMDELDETSDYSFYNHFNTVQQSQDSDVFHRGIVSGIVTGLAVGEEYTVYDPIANIAPGQYLEGERVIPSMSLSQLANDLESAYAGTNEVVVVERKYTSPNSAQAGIEEVLRNDTVVLNTVFDNYFAYDDGSAEAAVRLTIGHEVAVGFTSNVDDTLRAVQFNFPRLGPQSPNTLFNLKVYIGSLSAEAEPAYVRNLIKPFYVDLVLDSLQGFTTYRLRNSSGELTPLFIPAGAFYVAWEQASSNESKVHIGLDFNTPEAQPYQFYNNNIEWFAIPDEGALMIRPVMGNVTPIETRVSELNKLTDWMEIYPNPAQNQVNFELKEGSDVDYKVELLTATGQLVHSDLLSNTLDISHLSQGMYFVKVTQIKTNTVLTQRLVVAK